jgi:hypothetical protein
MWTAIFLWIVVVVAGIAGFAIAARGQTSA